MNKNLQKTLENNQESSPKTEIMVDDEDQDKDQEVIKNMTNFLQRHVQCRKNQKKFTDVPTPKQSNKPFTKEFFFFFNEIQEYKKKTRMGLIVVEQL